MNGGALTDAQGHNLYNKNETVIAGGQITGSGEKFAGIYNAGKLTQEGLAPFAYGVTGARAVWSASITGIVVHMVGGILGLVMIAAFNIIETENNFLSSFGFALVVIGIVHIRNYIMITKNEETIKKRQIAETDERNIAIANKAKKLQLNYVVEI